MSRRTMLMIIGAMAIGGAGGAYLIQRFYRPFQPADGDSGRPKVDPLRKDATVTVGGKTFWVQIADDDDERYLGLSWRDHIPDDQGMLFVFPRPGERTFVMRNCFTPIDIAFIDRDGYVVNTREMTVEPDPSHDVERYRSAGPAQYVLEVAGGAWASLGVTAGAPVTFDGVPGASSPPDAP